MAPTLGRPNFVVSPKRVPLGPTVNDLCILANHNLISIIVTYLINSGSPKYLECLGWWRSISPILYLCTVSSINRGVQRSDEQKDLWAR